MKSTPTNCLLSGGFTPFARPSSAERQFDAQAFQNLRIHAEELALELAVRLRVLGKSLFAGCQEPVALGQQKSGGAAAYAALRRHLDHFLSSHAEDGLAEGHSLPLVRQYLQDLLPLEPNGGCLGRSECPVQQVDVAIAILSGPLLEHECVAGKPMTSFSL